MLDVAVQVTVTAETGTVLHPANDVPDACTDRVQVLVFEPPVRPQFTVAEELPATLGVTSGSVAAKLMLAGDTESPLTVETATMGDETATIGRFVFCPKMAGAKNSASPRMITFRMEAFYTAAMVNVTVAV